MTWVTEAWSQTRVGSREQDGRTGRVGEKGSMTTRCPSQEGLL
jgi:hypothetical protein